MKLDSAFQHPLSGLLLALRSTAFVFTQVSHNAPFPVYEKTETPRRRQREKKKIIKL